jgi:hypothetical protein
MLFFYNIHSFSLATKSSGSLHLQDKVISSKDRDIGHGKITKIPSIIDNSFLQHTSARLFDQLFPSPPSASYQHEL